MNSLKIFLIMMSATLSIFFGFNTYANDTADYKNIQKSEEYKISEDKIYLHPDQVSITDKGIFVFIDDIQIPVTQLNYDEIGLFCWLDDLDTITDKCGNKHKMWCGRCGGCVVRWCKFRCKCVEWE